MSQRLIKSSALNRGYRGMYVRSILRLTYLILLLAWSVPSVAQQQSPRSPSYGFVSPNTREGLKLEEAIRYLNSQEEEALMGDARTFGCVARSPISTHRAIGSWSDGAEHSVLLQAKTNEPTLRYLLASLGRKAQQKAVLYFSQRQRGPAILYSLQPQRKTSFQSIAKALDAAGVEFRTLVPIRRSITVYVVDTTRQLRAKVKTAARRLRARVIARSGVAEFIGDDSSREKARLVFDNEIRDYEAKHSALISKCQKP